MPRGYVGDQWIRDQAYYEFKDVPVKGRVYRYWYFRIFADGKLRSIYCGKQRPELSPLEAAAAFRAGDHHLAARFREQRSGAPLPKRPRLPLPEPPAVTRRSIAVARRALAVRLELGRERALPRGPRLPKPASGRFLPKPPGRLSGARRGRARRRRRAAARP